MSSNIRRVYVNTHIFLLCKRATSRLLFFLLTILNTCITYPVRKENIMNLIELEKQIEEHKIIQAFQDGISDAMLTGVRDENQSHHYYKRGYDFGITLFCTMENR